MSPFLTALICALMSASADGFVIPTQQKATVSLHAGKGFGGDTKPKSKNPAPQPPASASSPDDSFKTMAVSQPAMNDGQIALDKLRRERAEKRNAELQKMKSVQDTDEYLREQPGAAAIPEKVAQRMGKRMLPFVGVPLFGGMAAFVGFWYMATYRNVEFEPALVAASTIAILAIGLVGITYSVMSASWDEDREGDFLGAEEFSRNLDNIRAGLSRSSENARLREEMSFVPSEEWERLERESNREQRRAKSFNEKIGQEFGEDD